MEQGPAPSPKASTGKVRPGMCRTGGRKVPTWKYAGGWGPRRWVIWETPQASASKNFLDQTSGKDLICARGEGCDSDDGWSMFGSIGAPRTPVGRYPSSRTLG